MIMTMTLAVVPIVVRTPRDLEALALETYIFGAVAGLIFLLLAALIAHGIKYEGGAHPRDPGKRRLWFWVLAVLSFVSYFLYNMYGVQPTIAPNLHGRFMTANLIGSTIAVAVYVAVGFALSKMFATGKLGNWFPSRR